MPDEKRELLIMKSDEELDQDMRDMNDEEIVAHYRRMLAEIENDPETLAIVPPGTIETIKAAVDDMEKANHACRVVVQKEAIAGTRLEHTIGTILTKVDKSRGISSQLEATVSREADSVI